MGDNFKVVLEAMIDQSSLTNAQKQAAKNRLKIGADISIEDFSKSKQAIEKLMTDLAKVIKTILGDAVSDKQATQWANKYYNEMISGAKKLAAEQQKNLDLARKQDELSRKSALTYTQNASRKLSDAVNKYSYGDSKEANKMIKQMNRGVSNFGNLEDIEGTVKRLDAVVDNIISNLKKSHQESLLALNEEINAEEELQALKDKSIYNGIDEDIAKKQRESKKFSDGLKQQMQEDAKIQLQIDDGTYDAKMSDLIAKSNQWTDASGRTRVNVEQLTATYQRFANANDGYDKIDAAKQLDVAIKEATNSVRQMNVEYAKDSEISSLHQKVQEFYDKNSATHRKWGAQLKGILEQTGDGAELTKQDLQKLSSEFVNIGNSARQAGKLGQSFWDKLKGGVKTFTQWTSATSIVMKTLQKFKEGTQFILELDNALTDVAYTSNISKSGLEDLGNSSVKMAKDLNTSAENVLDAVKIYSTANSTAEDIMRKSKPAIMLSNVSGMSGADSAKMINTAINQFDIEDTADGLLDVVDTLEYVSGQLNYDFTEGMKEISEGIEASGSVAKNAGLDMQEYATMVGLAVEQTGQSGSTIGQSYKTILSRITKASAVEGTSAEDISKAETALRGIGVEVRASNNEFRDMSDIMADIGRRWSSLSDVQKSNVGYEIAGYYVA